MGRGNWSDSTFSTVAPDMTGDDLPAFTAMAVYMAVLAVTGLVGNTLAILSVVISPRFRTPSYAFIVNLSVADLTINALVIPLMVVSFFNYGWPPNPFWCHFVCYTFFIALSSSFMTLTMIAASRCGLVSCTRKSYKKYCGWKGTTLALVFNWLAAVFLALLYDITGLGTIHYDSQIRFCFPDSSVPSTYWYITAILIRDTVMCLIVIPILYCKTFHTLHVSKKHCNAWATRRTAWGISQDSLPNNRRQGGLHQAEIKLTRMMALIFVVIVICWIPLWIIHFFKLSFLIPESVHRMGLMLILTNSSINPYLYAWLNQNFRRAYKRILLCGRQHRIHNLQGVV